MRVYLIGYMASGKTRFGMELGAKTGCRFIDTDELFEKRYRISIMDFFKKYNEESFRRIEKELLQETLAYPDAIIATGGGTPCFFDNMEVIKRNGISIYLKLDVISLVNRLAIVRKKRPLLNDRTTSDLESYIRTQIAERELFYNQADFIVDAENMNINDVLNLLPELPRIN